VPLVPHLAGAHKDAKLNLRLPEKVPLSAAIQALQDFAGLGFGVRDYGIVVVAPKGQIDPLISPQDFLRQSAAKALNPPAAEVRGEVKAVEDKTGLIQISIGSDAGLETGHTLEVYRLKPNPKYIGPIEIIEVRPKESVAKPIRNLGVPVQLGDQVGTVKPSVKQ
jgi:hypothetical protein